MSVTNSSDTMIEMFKQTRELDELEALVASWSHSKERGPFQERVVSLKPAIALAGAVLGIAVPVQGAGLLAVLQMAAGACLLYLLTKLLSRLYKSPSWLEVIAKRVRSYPGQVKAARATLLESWDNLESAAEQQALTTWWINEEMSELMARRDALEVDQLDLRHKAL